MMGEIPLKYITARAVIDYFRDGGVVYPGTVLEGIESLPWQTEEHRVLFAILYVTGARISEVLELTTSDVYIGPGGYLYFTLGTRKNPHAPLREVGISPKLKYEKVYYDIIDDYVQKIRRRYGKGEPLFPGRWGNKFKTARWAEKLTKQYWTKIVSKELQRKYTLRPHLFRHTRLSHLVKYFGFREPQLMRWAGWSSPTPAARYVHLFGHDLVEMMEAGYYKHFYIGGEKL